MNKKLKVDYLPIKTLIPYARNARTHSPGQIKQIANSIQAFGFINPIIVDANNIIVAGHARVLAAKEIGLTSIPAIRVDHLTETEERAYILADNKLAENAGWDKDLLKFELEYLIKIDNDCDVDLTGFSVGETDLILSATSEAVEEDVQLPLPSTEETVTKSGDLWQLGPHRLGCEDCRNSNIVDRLMENKIARMVITDPPYNAMLLT